MSDLESEIGQEYKVGYLHLLATLSGACKYCVKAWTGPILLMHVVALIVIFYPLANTQRLPRNNV